MKLGIFIVCLLCAGSLLDLVTSVRKLGKTRLGLVADEIQHSFSDFLFKEKLSSSHRSNNQLLIRLNSHNKALSKQNGNIENFTCNKQNIQKYIDPRFSLKFLMDQYISADKTLRFFTSDSKSGGSVYSKLYFKGDPKQCKFHNRGDNPSFSDALEDCANHKMLINRLFNRPNNAEGPLKKSDKPIFSTVMLPQCVTTRETQAVKTHYYNIFELPQGEDLRSRCNVGKFLTRDNSCQILLKKVARRVLKTLKVFNSGKRFFKHGNLYAHNIYLYETRTDSKLFVDNMLFDTVKYDDKNNKPFKSDFNQLGDLLITLVTGSDQFKLKDPKNTFHVFSQVKKYLEKNNFPVTLNSYHLNMPQKFMATPKCVTLSELEWLLRNTFFNFVYRLKCTATNKPYRFVEIDQALKHGFVFEKKSSEKWDEMPAEY